jgi:hypothetical protein
MALARGTAGAAKALAVLELAADDEEGRADVARGQRVEHKACDARLRAVVEGEADRAHPRWLIEAGMPRPPDAVRRHRTGRRWGQLVLHAV